MKISHRVYMVCIFFPKLDFCLSWKQIHGETIRRHSMLQDKVKKLLDVQSLVWQKIDKVFQSARCMVTFLSNSQF